MVLNGVSGVHGANTSPYNCVSPSTLSSSTNKQVDATRIPSPNIDSLPDIADMKDLLVRFFEYDLAIADFLGASTLVLVVRAFYLVCTIAILTARLLPPLRQRFLSYGARAQYARISKDAAGPRTSSKLLDWVALITVPHRFFTHFYILSLVFSLYWLLSLYQRRSVVDVSPAQSLQNALLCVSLMIVQNIRRLLECITFSSGSTSRMWVGHYIFGLSFYFFTNLAAWAESWNLSPRCSPSGDTGRGTATLQISAGLVIFVVASCIQYSAHAHLASLRKYSVPNHLLFKQIIAPHYTAECAIYLALAMVGASSPMSLNKTLLCVVILTTVNLGITAEGTKSWMLEKFKDRHGEIERRWCLLPGLW